MKDNDIKKALECCSSSTGAEACRGCPFNEKDICDKEDDAPQKYALDLINRQKAEIERLQIRNKTLTEITKNYDWKFSKAKSETIKEFAERLKEKKINIEILRMPFLNRDIDNLVKEMTEGSK